MKQHQAKQEGFTIIEVMLVLAIAALIFLMVFVALPALQRGQRDTARKNDVQNIAAAVTQYTSNNRGKSPTVMASRATWAISRTSTKRASPSKIMRAMAP